MTPERLAEIQASYDGLATDAYAPDHPATHASELLAEVQRLTALVAQIRAVAAAMPTISMRHITTLIDTSAEESAP